MPALVLIINPGSHSTRVALHDRSGGVFAATLPTPGLTPAGVLQVLPPVQRDQQLQAVVARGGLLKPLAGGVYTINDRMLADLSRNRFGKHASNLGAQLAAPIAGKLGLPALIVDPVTTNEFESLARISGVPGIERRCRCHALNIKAVAKRAAGQLGKELQLCGFVVAHLGGGISVAAVEHGRIVDVNDGLLGMGPFSPRRAGALPIRAVLDLAYTRPRDEVEDLLTQHSGLQGYLGSDDLPVIEKRIEQGEALAREVVQAMIYQIAKEIGAMTTVLKDRVDGIILTGGMAHSDYILAGIRSRSEHLGPVLVFSGQFEMAALAEGAFRVLDGTETACEYE